MPFRPDLFGTGDAVFVDDVGRHALVVELKALHQGSGRTACRSRCKARKTAREQALRYAQHYRRLYPRARVRAAICCEQDDLYDPNIEFVDQGEAQGAWQPLDSVRRAAAFLWEQMALLVECWR